MTNTELEQSVRDELAWDPRIDAAEVAVSADNGTVTLRGTVHTLQEKMAARRAAERVIGVIKVDDQLEPKILERREDNELRGAVLQALMLDSRVPSTIDVVATDGVITLKGTAARRFQRDAAFDAASRVLGVFAVEDEITLPVSTPDAYEVQAAITRALKRNAELDAGGLAVEPEDGTVTISGDVSSWSERDQAITVAWAAPGVRTVVDNIHVTD